MLVIPDGSHPIKPGWGCLRGPALPGSCAWKWRPGAATGLTGCAAEPRSSSLLTAAQTLAWRAAGTNSTWKQLWKSAVIWSVAKGAARSKQRQEWPSGRRKRENTVTGAPSRQSQPGSCGTASRGVGSENVSRKRELS